MQVVSAISTPGTVVNGVLIGHAGELYLAHGGHSVLDIVTGRKTVEDSSLAAFESNIMGRAAACAAVNATYRHIIFPDKQSVVQDRFPFTNPICLSEVYEQQCPDAREDILNLTNLYRAHPDKLFKTIDTHPTDLGLLLAAVKIVETLTGVVQRSALDVLRAKPVFTTSTAGDLGARFDPQLKCIEESITTDWLVHFFNNDIGVGNDGLIDIYLSPSAVMPERVLWFGDSFGRGCLRFLSYFFKEIIFMRTRFFHQEMLQQVKPDIVVTQNVERYLDVVTRDEEAPPFLLYPALKGDQRWPSVRFTQALAAVLSFQKPRYIRFMADHGIVRGANIV